MAKKTEHQFVLTAKDKTRAATKSSSDNFKEVGRAAGTVAGSVAKIGISAATVGGAVAYFSAESTIELQNLARVANATLGEFQSLASATSTVGVEQGKLSDILKDVNDRVGDFLETGGGPMAAFFEKIAPQVGVTAEQFATLSGPESLQLYVQSLQDANLSQSQMTFYMEAIASDSTQLLSLYADNGKELNRLTDRYNRFNEELTLTANQADGMRELGQTFDLVGETSANAARQLTATLAPELQSFLDMALELIPKTTVALVDFINAFKDASDITSLSALDRQIESVAATIADLEASSDDLIYRTTTGQDELNKRLLVHRQRLDDLRAARERLEQQETDEEFNNRAGGDPKSVQDAENVALEIKDIELKTWDEIQEEKELRHLKSLQLQLMAEKKANEQRREQEEQLMEERKEAALNLTNALGDLAIQQADQKYQSELRALRNTEGLTEEEIENRRQAARETFEQNKLLQKGMVGINTGAAVMNELANNPDPWSKWLTVTSIVALGAKQAAAINSQQFGGASSVAGASRPSGAVQNPANNMANQGGQVPQNVSININTGGNNDPDDIVRALRDFFNNDGVLFEQGSAQQQVVNG